MERRRGQTALAIATTTLIGLSLAGCAANRTAQQCFVVIERKLPRAEVCAGETMLRYHQIPNEELSTVIPPEVAAVLVIEGHLNDLSRYNEGGYTVYNVASGLERQTGPTEASNLYP